MVLHLYPVSRIPFYILSFKKCMQSKGDQNLHLRVKNFCCPNKNICEEKFIQLPVIYVKVEEKKRNILSCLPTMY